jgi:hypothetical protein
MKYTKNSRATHNLYMLVMSTFLFIFTIPKSQILPECQQLVRLGRRNNSWAQL